ncbi:MAG: hypothetical protein OEW58_13010 [Gammaproteobacteria bacterium]|nr:hypothetical protein [Gammaproteobacteria bacterium]
MKLIYRLLLVFISLIPVVSNAFDTKTHVYIGQKVIDDLNRSGDKWGKVNIPPFGDFSIKPDVRDAILNNQSVYLMGNVGPDGYPDLIGGQQTTHPGGVHGDPNGWKTDAWMQFVLKKAQETPSPKNLAFAYGFLGHGAGDFWAHTYVNWYSGDQFELFDEDRVQNETRHSALEKYIAKHQPILAQGDVSNLVATGEMLPLDFLTQIFISNDGVNSEYGKIGATTHLWAMYQIEKKLIELEKDAYDNSLWDMQNSASQIYAYFYSSTAGIVTFAAAEVVSLSADLANISRCSSWQWYINYAWCASVEVTYKLIYDDLKSAESTLRKARDDVEKVTAAIFSYQKHISLWRESVQRANRAYIKASSRMAQEFLKPAGGDPMRHLSNWALCYGGVYTSIYQPVNQVACEAIGLTADMVSELNNAIGSIASLGEEYSEILLIVNPTLYSVVQAANHIKSLTDQVKDFAKRKFISEFVDSEVLAYVNIIQGHVGDAELKAAYELTGSGKGLLEISDVAERVKSDMKIKIDGTFDPDKFNVVKNSIVMAKLTLLGADGLNELVSRAGINKFPKYKTFPLFFDEPGFSIFTKSVRSIDGNHAWMPVAPRNPRKEGFVDNSSEDERHFGYYLTEDGFTQIGFKLWQEEEVREKVFLAIFSGPLAPGLEYPQSQGIKRVIPVDYKDYVACNVNPYPKEIGDLRCYSEWLVPIVSGMLNN